MSTNDDRENAPENDEPERALGPGAKGDIDHPAEGLDAPVPVEPVGTEPVDGGVVADAPTPAVTEPTATEAAPAATNEGR
jgi:hypothetical protein